MIPGTSFNMPGEFVVRPAHPPLPEAGGQRQRDDLMLAVVDEIFDERAARAAIGWLDREDAQPPPGRPAIYGGREYSLVTHHPVV